MLFRIVIAYLNSLENFFAKKSIVILIFFSTVCGLHLLFGVCPADLLLIIQLDKEESDYVNVNYTNLNC